MPGLRDRRPDVRLVQRLRPGLVLRPLVAHALAVCVPRARVRARRLVRGRGRLGEHGVRVLLLLLLLREVAPSAVAAAALPPSLGA